jgi:putative radical SAM enzyme (TIGR03279 family)
MSFPQVVAVAASSPAAKAGIVVGDEIRSMNGMTPRDVIEYQLLADEAEISLEIGRGGLVVECLITKHAGELLGIEVSSPVFDRVRTCDNHCEFCFIYQLPKGMRKSLYVKDDDYRLSFLYGNFTTLTRFTELDLERVVSERLSPLYVSIHATDPDVRARMLNNRRGATSLRWLRALLDHGIKVHGQIVCCPGLNDGDVLHDSLGGILERFSDLSSVAVVPLGVSKYSKEPAMRPHSLKEARAVLEVIEEWQGRFLTDVGRHLVFAADEYYLLAGRDFPELSTYEDLAQLENGVGMARAFQASFEGRRTAALSHHARGGFFQSVDGAPAIGYRAPRGPRQDLLPAPKSTPTTILSGRYGEAVLRPILDKNGYAEVRVMGVDNAFFGGNIAVTGLMTGADVARALSAHGEKGRYLLPDVCLSEGRFLDGGLPKDLPRPVEVIETTGVALRRALGPPVTSNETMRDQRVVGAGAR